MAVTRIPFATMDWVQSPTNSLEHKKVAAERSLALLRFEPGFADPNVCQRSHVLYVLQGALELELDDRIERIAAGEACWLDGGSAHRARNPGDVPAVVLIVSDIAPEAS